MIFWLVASISWACPGGWFGGFIPAAVKPLACQGAPQVEHFERLDKAEARIRELGPGSTLIACRGLRFKTVPITWVTEPVFKEVKP